MTPLVRRAGRALAALLMIAGAVPGLGGARGVAPLAAQTPNAVSPPAAASEPGADLQVYVMTMGQGDLLWERFGHNALGVRDPAAGTDIVYNWGTFSFEQPGFLARFLRGEMLYWMAPYDAVGTLMAYQQDNRSVTVQELALTPAQKLEIRRFVEWNQRDENKFYRYDYYLDNCSTRVRDALDRVLGGAIRRMAAAEQTTMTFRDHSLRLMDGMFWTRTGIDLGLGRPTDRPITGWEAMFIPMELERRLRDVTVPNAAGELVPLVSAERELFVATRTPERMDVPSNVLLFLLVGIGVSALLVALALRVSGRAFPATVGVGWATIAGLLGTLLLLLWIATKHTATHGNQNLFFANPLWLIVAATLPFVRATGTARRVMLFVVRSCAVLTLIGAALALTPWGQPSGAIAAFVAPINLAMYVLALRVAHVAPARARDRAASQAAAVTSR